MSPPVLPAAGQLEAASPRRSRVEVSWATFLRGLAVGLLVWVWLRLWFWFLVFVAGAFLAVALDPAVQWLERHRVPRRTGALGIVLAIVTAFTAVVAVAGASLTQDAQLVSDRMTAVAGSVIAGLPDSVRGAVAQLGSSGGGNSVLADAPRALTNGVLALILALAFTAYLLIDGRRTYEWLLVYVPPSARGKVERSARAARQIVRGYVRGNVITSAIAAVLTFAVLSALGVPAAVLLALMAGVLNFVPVVGLLVSAVPAVLLGVTVSPAVGLGVAAFYALYNVIENYYIQPRVYGQALRVSDLAVIVAFLVGAELGGVLGAIVALPIAAMYPAVEKIWFDRGRHAAVAAEHREVEADDEH